MSTVSKNSSAKQERRVFGRRSGRPLNTSQKQAMEDLLPSLSLDTESLTETGDLPIVSLFDQSYDEYCFEIGFGGGEHLATLIQTNPKTGYLGAEPYSNGVASFLKHIKNMEHQNVRVLMDDAMFLAKSLENECLDRLYVLNPDPWHKKRHHKRRIINSENLDHFARILKPGGQLIASTDVPYLAEWIIIHVFNHPAFEWSANSCKDWKNRPSWWPDHRYASKGAKGASEMHYFIFHKT